MPVESIHQIVKLLFADIRRRAAAEVGQPKLPTLQRGRAAVDFILFDQRVEIDLDLRSVLVRVDFEVTKFAPLAAEWDVNVKPERLLDASGTAQRLDRVRDVFRFPLRERRIVGDEIIADFSFDVRCVCHCEASSANPIHYSYSSVTLYEFLKLRSSCRGAAFDLSPAFQRREAHDGSS